VTKPLEGKLKSFRILKDARDWQTTSDHVPVMIELDL
jgi:endonuclease/exonuclease/phosphatase family metal-dependent hydrolase